MVIAFRIRRKSRYSHANSKRSVFYGLASCWDLRLRTITYWRSTRILGPSLARVLNNDPM